MSHEIRFKSTNTIFLTGPTAITTGVFSASGTCTASLYHDRKDTYLTGTELASQTVLSVADASLYESTVDNVVVQKDDLTFFDCGVVTAVASDSNLITVTNALDGTASKGSAVRVRLGPIITLAAYGTPATGTHDWGYRGTITPTHADLRVGLPVRIEITLTDAGVVLDEVIKTIVTGGS